MRYVIAGATSGTGNAVVKRLVEKVGSENVICLVRRTSDTDYLHSLGVRCCIGDVTDQSSLGSIVDAGTIYIDMTHPRYYANSLEILTKAGVERAYFVTTTGIFSKYHSCSYIYKHGEKLIRDTGITYTILRPSMIYGTARDKNMHKLITFLNRSPVFPLFAFGRSQMQPVYVEDLASGIVAAVGDVKTEYKEYNLAGPSAVTYREIVEIIIKLLNRRVGLVNINADAARFAVRLLQWIPKFPINQEQVLRLKEDKVFDIQNAVADLGYSPRSFEEGIKLEIQELKDRKLI